jgi:rRNA maturation RNase YbeY
VTPPIRISNRQRAFRPDRQALRRLAAALFARVVRACPARRWRELTLLLTDDAACARINAAALGRDEPTDVIAIVYPAVPGEPPGDSAEIVLNLERAWRLGRAPPAAAAELALYLAHGCDHLCGHDDATPAARRRMRRRERRWLAVLDIPVLFLPRPAAGVVAEGAAGARRRTSAAGRAKGLPPEAAS